MQKTEKRKRIINPYTKCCRITNTAERVLHKSPISCMKKNYSSIFDSFSARSDLQSDRYKYEHL